MDHYFIYQPNKNKNKMFKKNKPITDYYLGVVYISSIPALRRSGPRDHRFEASVL